MNFKEGWGKKVIILHQQHDLEAQDADINSGISESNPTLTMTEMLGGNVVNWKKQWL